jgi:hypothetical protein
MLAARLVEPLSERSERVGLTHQVPQPHPLLADPEHLKRLDERARKVEERLFGGGKSEPPPETDRRDP